MLMSHVSVSVLTGCGRWHSPSFLDLRLRILRLKKGALDLGLRMMTRSEPLADSDFGLIYNPQKKTIEPQTNSGIQILTARKNSI